MTAKKDTKSAAPAAKSASKAKKNDAANTKTAAKSKTTARESCKAVRVKSPVPAKKRVAPVEESSRQNQIARSHEQKARAESETGSREPHLCAGTRSHRRPDER